jgi:hypothetical protein
VPKRIYTGFSFYSLLVSLAIRLALVIAIILVYPHYDENPAVITVVLFLCGLFIFIIGNDEIIVYEDRIIKTDLSFWSMLFKRSKRIIFLADVERAYIKQRAKSTFSEAVVAVAIIAAFKKNDTIDEELKAIYFDLNDGNILQLQTDLNTTVTEKIVAAVNSALQKNIKR